MTKREERGYWLDLAGMAYEPAFEIQDQVLRARIVGKLGPTIILQENPPVFTIGRSGSRENILSSSQELDRLGIQVLDVNRGGDVTYHGPGQLIVSPLLYLGDIGLNANAYMHRLEDVLIRFLAKLGIFAGKKDGYPGVWLGKSKIAAVGIAVKHGFTFHGFSLNVNPDLNAFNLINPCGVARMPVTSLEQVMGQAPPMAEVKKGLRTIIHETFGLMTRTVTWPDFQEMLERKN